MANDRPWFVYQRTAGRMTGRPASWKGWLAMAASLTLPVLMGTPLIVTLIRAGHPVLGGLALVTVLLFGLLLLFRLMLAKGHRVD